MNWINIHTDTLRSQSYLGADPIERATWLNLISWCCSQENGGIIEGANAWSDRKWQQLCGITKKEATLVSDLYYTLQNGNLVVSFYPVEKEQEVKAKREVARVNGTKGGRPKREESKTGIGTDDEPTLVEFENPQQTQGESGREGKGREGEREKEFSQLADVLSLYDLYPRKKAKAAAIKAIRSALKKTDLATLTAAVSRFAKSQAGKDPNFIPYPATWFNGGQWEDDDDHFAVVQRGNTVEKLHSTQPSLSLAQLMANQ